jgi:hypothetical protein
MLAVLAVSAHVMFLLLFGTQERNTLWEFCRHYWLWL